MQSITYLVGSLFYILLWSIVFILRKDLRKRILIMSFIISILGLLISGFVWTYDWWMPSNITQTKIGIEDFIFGFGMGGLLVSIYAFAFKKKYEQKSNKNTDDYKTFFVIIISVLLGAVASLGFGLKSWIAWLIAIIIPTVIMYIEKPFLIKQSLWTGSMITIFSIPVYWVMQLLEPSYVTTWWFSNNMTGILLVGIPIEDILWFFSAGMFIGVIYDFWYNKKIVDVS